MSSVDIKVANRNYYEKIYNLIIDIADESNQFAFTSEDFMFNKDMFFRYIDSFSNMGNSVFLIALIDSEVVGFGYLEGGKRVRTCHLTNLGIGVSKSFRKKGIGKIILNELVSFAKKSDCIAKIDLQVRKDNLFAINLYKKFNFLVEGVNKRALFLDGEFVDYVNMGLVID